MNKVLEYNVTGQSIELSSTAMLVAGTVNEYTARFSFGADWDGYQRVAVFNADGTEREQLLTDDTCKVPWEVLLPGAYLKVGVYGTKDGSRLPTIWTSHRQYIHDGAGPTEEAAAPSPVLAEQILQRMGDLGALKTEDKSSLVAAINEVHETGGGGGTADHSKLKNRDAADQHPMRSITGLADALAGKLPASELPAAINTALAQAKASGEFDGKDGSPGADGKDGVGIQSVTQTTTSTEDGGANIVTVTKTDGTTSTFEVRNGSRGSIGPSGADGKDGSQGPAGADGKTAYQYAQEGGYTGTEAEFAEKMAAEIPEAYTLPIAGPTVLGGVQPVAKTDAMTQSVGVDANGGLWAPPGSGGGETYTGEYELIVDHTVTADEASASSFTFTKDAYPLINGQKMLVMQISKPASVSTPWFDLIAGSTTVGKISTGTFQYVRGLSIVLYNRWLNGTVTLTNKNALTYLSPTVMLTGDSGPTYQSKPYQHYTSIKLYSYKAFLEGGTVIKIYGGK